MEETNKKQNFLKRKVKIFGKGIPVFVLTLLVLGGLGTASLVGYLSTTVTVNIEVSSPMVVGISEGHDSWSTTECWRDDQSQMVDSFPECDYNPDIHDWEESDWEKTETPLEILGIHGGETITLYTMSANLADAEISGFEEAIVTNWAGVNCSDFESVKVRTDSIYGDHGYGTEHELISLGACTVIDDYHVWFGTLDNSIWGAGETDVSKMVVTFKTDALGTYTFTYRVVPV